MTNVAEVLRSQQVNLKLTPEEVERLERLAKHYALTPQSMLRMLLKQASDAHDASLKSAKPRGRK